MPSPYDETDALRQELRRRRIAPGEAVWAISEAPAHIYPGQVMAYLRLGGRDASGAIAATAHDAMRDAAWALLDEEGAMDRYTQIAWTTQERWFSVLGLTMRTKPFSPNRLVCNIQVDSTRLGGRKAFVAVLTVDAAEFVRGDAQQDRRTAMEDAAQALMMDVAKLEGMLAMPRNLATPQASPPVPRRGKGRRVKHALTSGEAESAGQTVTLEKPWSTSSATESEEDRGPELSDSVSELSAAGDEATKASRASLEVPKHRRKRGWERGRTGRKATKLET